MSVKGAKVSQSAVGLATMVFDVRGRRVSVAVLALMLVLSAIVMVYLLWPWYVDSHASAFGWEVGNSHAQSSCITCGDRINRDQSRFAWPLRYKPEWTSVSIQGCTFTTQDAYDLSRAQHIEKLYLGGVAFEPGALRLLCHMPRLSHVEFHMDINAADLRDLGKCRSLTSVVFLGRPPFTRDVAVALSEIRTLQSLRISGVVTADDLEPLARLPNLLSLRVGCLLPSPSVISVFQRMAQLQELELSPDLDDAEVARELHTAFPHLHIRPLFK